VFILPSQGFEALGMVCAEAMACGTPVVASDLDGIKDIVIDQVTGLTFTPGDEMELKEKILLAFKHTHRLSREAFKHVDNFRWENIAKEYEKVI
jgi:D-inositol-3-phosphate glycosyltransferase